MAVKFSIPIYRNHYKLRIKPNPSTSRRKEFRSTQSSLNLAGNKRTRSRRILLVVEMRRSDRSTTLANIVASMADGKRLGRSNLAKRLPTLRVSKDDNSGDTCRVGGRGAKSSVVNKLRALRVAGENDLGVGAAGRCLSGVSCRLLQTMSWLCG